MSQVNPIINKNNNLIKTIEKSIQRSFKNKSILSLKYEDVLCIINFIQVSVIVVSIFITFMESVKIRMNYTGFWWDITPIFMTTYITFIMALLRFFKWEELKENVTKSILNHTFLINKMEKTLYKLKNFDIESQSIEELNHIIFNYENDVLTLYLSVKEEFDNILTYKEIINYKNIYKRFNLELEFVHHDLNHINNAKNLLEQVPKSKFLKRNNCCYRYLCCKPKYVIKYREFMAEKINFKKKDESTLTNFERNTQTDAIVLSEIQLANTQETQTHDNQVNSINLGVGTGNTQSL